MRVVVTGASRGIGRATALLLAEAGAQLALLGRPSAELERTVADCTAAGSRAQWIACDVADPDAIELAAKRVLDELGVPDVLVNNAGTIQRAPVEHTDAAAWDHHLSVNLRGPALLTRAFLPAMRAAGRGRIINVGSISSTLGTANASAYNASKWGLVGFTKCLAEELSDSGLMTVALLPGSVDTHMLQGSGFAPRMSAEDVARTIKFLSWDAPPSHNGGVIEMFGT